MHTIKITPSILFEYQCTNGKFIRLPNRIESKLFLPELECSTGQPRILTLLTQLSGSHNWRGIHPQTCNFDNCRTGYDIKR